MEGYHLTPSLKQDTPYTKAYPIYQRAFSMGLSSLCASVSTLITGYAGGYSPFPSTGAELLPQRDHRLLAAQRLAAPSTLFPRRCSQLHNLCSKVKKKNKAPHHPHAYIGSVSKCQKQVLEII